MLPKLNVSLLHKDLLSLCVTLRDFPTADDAEDTFAERDDDAEDSFAERDDDVLADRLRRNVYTEAMRQADRLLSNVYTKAMRQAKRLQTALEGVENADCEPIPLDIMIDLQWRVEHLLLSEFRRNADGVVTSRPWASGPLPGLDRATLPGLDRATLPGFQGTLTTVKRSIERAEADDPTLWTREITKAALGRACKISDKTRQRRIKSGTYELHPDYTPTSRLIRVRLRGLPADAVEILR
jgi:hypothetical protein